MHVKTLLAVVATLAGMHDALAQRDTESLYRKDSVVTQITSKAQLDRLINQSNRTSVRHLRHLRPQAF